MKTCYACKGRVVKKNMNIEISGVTVQDLPAEACDRCGEVYSTTPTATFTQQDIVQL